MKKPDYSSFLETIARKTKSTRIVRFFPSADMRCSHDGLKKWAKEHGNLNMQDLSAGEFVVFANARQNRIKILAPGNVLAYLKSPDDRRIDMDVIRLIPRFFNGTEFNYDAALFEVLKEKVK